MTVASGYKMMINKIMCKSRLSICSNFNFLSAQQSEKKLEKIFNMASLEQLPMHFTTEPQSQLPVVQKRCNSVRNLMVTGSGCVTLINENKLNVITSMIFISNLSVCMFTSDIHSTLNILIIIILFIVAALSIYRVYY